MVKLQLDGLELRRLRL